MSAGWKDGVNGRVVRGLVLGAGIAFMAGWLRAGDMVGNVTLTANNGVLTLGGGDAPGITGTNSVWSWNDKNGNGTPGEAGDSVSAGLNMAGYTLTRALVSAANRHLTLDLWNGAGNGSITGNGVLRTTSPDILDNTPNNLTVTNVSSVTVNSVDTSTGDYNQDGGDQTFTGDDTGTFTVTAGGMKSYANGGGGDSGAGRIWIQDFTSVSVTGDTITEGRDRGGSVTIGQATNPIAGNITLGNIRASLASGATYAGSVSLYANGSIQVGNCLAGNFDGTQPWSQSGSFTAVHRGSFSGGTFTMIAARDGPGGSASFNGTDSSGSFTSGGMDIHRDSTAGGGVSGSITIQNYSNVTVNSDLSTHNISGNAGGAITITNGITGAITVNGNVRSSSVSSGAGNIMMVCTGNATITGSANLDGVADANDGDLSITNTGAGAMIRLGSLDINQVRNATLNAGSGKSHVLRELANFPTGTPMTSGLSAGADDKYVFYNPALPGNFYLLAAGSPLGAYGLGSGKGTLTNRVAAQELSAINWSSSSNTDFEAGGNWGGGTAPANDLETHAATFGTKGALANPALSANRSVGGVVFTNAGWTLSGGTRGRTLSVGIGGIDSAGSGTNTVSAKVALPPEWAGVWTVGSGNLLDMTGAVSSNGYLTKDGAGTLRLSATNTISGQIAVTGGALDVATDGGLGTAAFYMTGGTANFLSLSPLAASLRDGGANSGTVRLGNPGVNDTTLTVGSDNASTTFSGMLADAASRTGSVTKVGSGTLTLAGSNTFSGTLTVSGGALTGNSLASGSGQSPFGSNGSGVVALNGGTLTLTCGTATTAREPVSKGALAYAGPGPGISLYGKTLGSGAPVQLSLASLTRDSSFRTGLRITSVNGSLGTNEKLLVTAEPALTNGMVAAYMVGGASDFLTYDGAVGGNTGFRAAPYTLICTGGSDLDGAQATNIVRVDAAQTLTHGITVHALKINGPYTIQAGAGITMNVGSGGLNSDDSSGYSNAPYIQGNVAVNFASCEGIISVSGSKTFGIDGDIQGTSGFTKFGPGTLSIGYDTKTFSGLLTIAEGTLVACRTGCFGSASEVVFNGGTLNVADQDPSVNPTVRIGPFGGTMMGAGGDRAITINGKVTGSGRLTVSGNHNFIFVNPANDWTGRLTLSSGPTVRFYASAPFVGSLAGSGSMVMGPSSGSGTTRLTVGGDGSSTTFSGGISNQNTGNGQIGALVKAGGGTFRINGACTYTGGTTVSNGTLIVNGSLASAVVVTNAGSAFGGSVTVAGAITVGAGGVLAPGDGVGTLTAGSVNLADHAEIWCNMSGPDGTNVDKVVTGGLTLGANTVLRLFDTGVTGRPRGDSVLIQYSGDDPELGNWTVDCGDTGWPAGKVKQDTATKQIFVRFARNYGTVVVVR